MATAPTIEKASIQRLDALVDLFDAYRQFYRQQPDTVGARRFLGERLNRQDSILLLALQRNQAVGFTQLYPSFSSAAMARIFVVNDLFVQPEARSHGIGTALIEAAVAHARQAGAVRLTLSTELSNTIAQSVYERAGWIRDTVFCVYNFKL